MSAAHGGRIAGALIKIAIIGIEPEYAIDCTGYEVTKIEIRVFGNGDTLIHGHSGVAISGLCERRAS